jgi:hypothetical protein
VLLLLVLLLLVSALFIAAAVAVPEEDALMRVTIVKHAQANRRGELR